MTASLNEWIVFREGRYLAERALLVTSDDTIALMNPSEMSVEISYTLYTALGQKIWNDSLVVEANGRLVIPVADLDNSTSGETPAHVDLTADQTIYGHLKSVTESLSMLPIVGY